MKVTLVRLSTAALFLAPGLPHAAASVSGCISSTDALRATAADAAAHARTAKEKLTDAQHLERVRSLLQHVDVQLRASQVQCGEQDLALQQVEHWSATMAKSDARYRLVEDRMLKVVNEVIRTVPAQYWLPTLQILYRAISAEVR